MHLDQVTQNYDRAARYYDRMTDLVFGRLLGLERYRERAAELLGDVRGGTVLDLGCGTGRSFPLLVPRVGGEGGVVGVDYSEGMLAEARARREGWRNVELRRGDAATLDVVEGPVDGVLAVWSLGIVHDLEGALHRALEVLRPGGRIVIMDFDRARPDQGWLRPLYPAYSAVLRWTGIDSAEDLDDDRLRERWARGRAVLLEGLREVHEERYLGHTGFILSGAVA